MIIIMKRGIHRIQSSSLILTEVGTNELRFLNVLVTDERMGTVQCCVSSK